MPNWDWKVRSYSGKQFQMETAHSGELSLYAELDAIDSYGGTVLIVPVSEYARIKWKNDEFRADHERRCRFWTSR